MKSKQGLDFAIGDIDEQTVGDFLCRHPDFFDHNPEVLEALTLRHASGPAISLIERQVATLRERNKQLRQHLQSLLEIARENDRLNENIQNLAVALIQAATLRDTIMTFIKQLSAHFDAEIIVVSLVSDEPQKLKEQLHDLPCLTILSRRSSRLRLVRGIADSGRPVCGNFSTDKMAILFNQPTSEIQSTAVVPLYRCQTLSRRLLGMVAIGSRTAERFDFGLGTTFLTHIGNIFSAALVRAGLS